MNRHQFESSRPDGRSHADVLIAHVEAHNEPGRLFAFDELIVVLSDGLDTTFDRPGVCRVVGAAFNRLATELRRALHSVRTVGYRLAEASQHSMLALRRRRRADVQLHKGLLMLRHVRWEEMDPESTKVHRGHLMITEALVANQVAMERRLRRVEDAIAGLRADAPPLESESA